MKRENGYYWVCVVGVDREGNDTIVSFWAVLEFWDGWHWDENFFRRHGVGDDAEIYPGAEPLERGRMTG